MNDHGDDGLARVLRLLVTYRMLVYLGGLAAIGAPLALASGAGVELSPPARTAIVVVSLAAMVATYLAERRVGHDHLGGGPGDADDPGETYPLGMRVALAATAAGLAVALYLVLSDRLLFGALFAIGALLFAQVAYRRDRGEP